MHLDLVDLRLVVAIAEGESITRGAERANLALPSASARLRALEADLGVTLFQRHRRGVVPTAAGRCLIDQARRVLAEVDALTQALATHTAGLAGRVRLACNTAAFGVHVPPLLAGFLSHHPRLAVDVEEAESRKVVARVASGAADLGIAASTAVGPHLATLPFRRDQLVALCPSGDPLAHAPAVPFADLLARPRIGLPREAALERHLAARAAALGRDAEPRLRADGFAAIADHVAAGIGLAVMPEAAATRLAPPRGLAAVPLSDRWANRRLVLCMTPDAATLSKAARALIAHLAAPAGPA